jgi:hypothetical protein
LGKVKPAGRFYIDGTWPGYQYNYMGLFGARLDIIQAIGFQSLTHLAKRIIETLLEIRRSCCYTIQIRFAYTFIGDKLISDYWDMSCWLLAHNRVGIFLAIISKFKANRFALDRFLVKRIVCGYDVKDLYSYLSKHTGANRGLSVFNKYYGKKDYVFRAIYNDDKAYAPLDWKLYDNYAINIVAKYKPDWLSDYYIYICRPLDVRWAI